jgi:enamine deaminase RidA (YjgF/YER057c/UK114 family)
MSIESRLVELGITLPGVAKPVASYIPVTRTGNIVYTAGQLPMVEGTLRYAGKLGRDLGIEEGQESARISLLNALAAVKSEIGDLEKVERVLRMNVFVNSADEFTDQAKVANGASELLEKILGDRGKHTRCAIGANTLPLGAAVELDLIVAVGG